MVTTIAELQGILTLDDSQFKGGLQDAKSGMGSLGSNISNAGKNIAKFGLGASLALAPVTLFLKSSVGAFREWDVAMTNSQAILGATNEEMAVLNAQVLQMGKNTGLGPQAAADAFFTVVSGVQDATTHMDILQSSITLAEAGLADLAVTTDGMVAVMNAYQFAAEDASFVSDVFTRTVQMGVGTMDEFVAALKPLAGLSAELNISFEELAGAEALLTAGGVSASSAATQLQGVMVAFLKPNQDMVDALALMGFTSGSAAIEQLGLQGAVDSLSNVLGGSSDKMVQAMGRNEAALGAFALSGDEAVAFLDSFSSGVDGAAEAAAALQNATDQAISDAFKSKVDVLKILVGEGLSGAFADAQTALIPLVEEIIVWAEENPETIKQIVMMAAGLIALSAAAVIVGGTLTILGGVIGLLTSPILLVVAAFGLFFGAIATLFGIDLGPFQVVFDAVFTQLGKIVVGFVEGAIKVLEGLSSFLVGIIDKVGEAIDAIGNLSLFNFGDNDFLERQIARLNAAGQPQFVEPLPQSVQSFPALPFVFDRATSPGFTPPGSAEGGPFEAMQPLRVGERGPETVMFNQAGTVFPNEQSVGDTFQITIFANTEAEGRAAGRGFKQELKTSIGRRG